MPRPRCRCQFGFLPTARRERARRLCALAQRQARIDPEALARTCRDLRQELSPFAYEEPAAKIRARACGCPV